MWVKVEKTLKFVGYTNSGPGNSGSGAYQNMYSLLIVHLITVLSKDKKIFW